MSSMDWLEFAFPDSTNPAYRIQGGCFRAGRVWRTARRMSSAIDIPSAFASFLTKAYSCSSRLIWVRIMLSPTESMITHSADPQLVDPFQRRAALAADESVAIAANQRVGNRLGAGGAVELGGGLLGFGAYRPLSTPCPHFAAAIESTWMVFVFASSVPVTVTFLAANFSGVFWSLSV